MSGRRTLAVPGCLLAVLTGCGDADRAVQTTSPPATRPAAGSTHIASLAVDPADGTLFLGAADGLYRQDAGGRAARRVSGTLDRAGASGTISRLLVVAFARAGELVASGHPEPGGSLPEDLGLLRSTDGGRTWRSVSLLGRADLHVLRAGGARVVAVGAEEAEVRVSEDGGRTFRTRALPGVAVDLAVDPGDPSRMALSTQRGLFTSPDGGRGWRPREPATAGAQLAWAAPGALYRADADGRVSVSRDGGRAWQARGTTGAGATELASDARGALYAALPGAQVSRSDDGGVTWRRVVQLR